VVVPSFLASSLSLSSPRTRESCCPSASAPLLHHIFCHSVSQYLHSIINPYPAYLPLKLRIDQHQLVLFVAAPSFLTNHVKERVTNASLLHFPHTPFIMAPLPKPGSSRPRPTKPPPKPGSSRPRPTKPPPKLAVPKAGAGVSQGFSQAPETTVQVTNPTVQLQTTEQSLQTMQQLHFGCAV